MANLRTNNLSGEQGQNAYRGSVFFNGGNDALAVPASSDFAYGTGDFTVEAWIWKSARPATGEGRGIFTQTQSGNNYFVFWIQSTNVISIILGHSSAVTSTEKITVDAWNHVAVSRASGTVKVYVNGVATSGTSVTTDLNDTTRNPTIGNYTHAYGTIPFHGFISNLRVTKGEALYTADFTPPTTELTADANTVLLCCQNSDDVTQEATGKTITPDGSLVQTASELTAGELTSSNYSSAASDWSFSNGVATVSMSSSGYASLGSVPGRLVNGQLYELVVNVTTFNAGKITFGQANAGNADFTIALGRNVIRHVYTGSTQDSDGIAIYARDATGGGYATNLISLKQVIRGEQPKVIPPYGVDAGNTFGGPIQQSSQGYMYFPTGKTEERGRGRGIFACGYIAPVRDDTIDFINIQSMGNAQDFGDLIESKSQSAPAASSTRGTFSGGIIGSSNVIEFITIATTANALDFGDLAGGNRQAPGGLSNETRAVVAGGNVPAATNVIEFFTIANTGNSEDFGDAANVVNGKTGAASPTRGIFAGGYAPDRSQIEFITIASAGNATDFGECVEARGMPAGGSNATRAIFAGGDSPLGHRSSIDTLLIATTGNATDFGDLQRTITEANGGASNGVRICFAGGNSPGQSPQNVIDVVNIVTTGAGADFGDLTLARRGTTGLSDSHGGLS